MKEEFDPLTWGRDTIGRRAVGSRLIVTVKLPIPYGVNKAFETNVSDAHTGDPEEYHLFATRDDARIGHNAICGHYEEKVRHG